MSELGDAVREIRKGSRYRDLVSFSARASLSREGLRKIENGERIPGRETLQRILDASDASAGDVDRLLAMRDNAQAERDGLTLTRFSSSPTKISHLGDRLMVAVERWLGEAEEIEIPLPDKEKRRLRARFNKVLGDELSD